MPGGSGSLETSSRFPASVVLLVNREVVLDQPESRPSLASLQKRTIPSSGLLGSEWCWKRENPVSRRAPEAVVSEVALSSRAQGSSLCCCVCLCQGPTRERHHRAAVAAGRPVSLTEEGQGQQKAIE